MQIAESFSDLASWTDIPGAIYIWKNTDLNICSLQIVRLSAIGLQVQFPSNSVRLLNSPKKQFKKRSVEKLTNTQQDKEDIVNAFIKMPKS